MDRTIQRKDEIRYGTIYCIVNIADNKRYIGSSLNYNKRRKTHISLLQQNKHHNIHLQRAWTKYGEESFIFEVLCHEPENTLLARETWFITNLKPEYNISKDGLAPMTGRKHSPETLNKFKFRRTGKGIKKGPWSEEMRKNQLAARTGLKRSQEFKDRRREEAKQDNRARYLKESTDASRRKIKDSLGNIFDSLTSAAKYHNISTPTVCDILKGRHSKTRKGISFEYA